MLCSLDKTSKILKRIDYLLAMTEVLKMGEIYIIRNIPYQCGCRMYHYMAHTGRYEPYTHCVCRRTRGDQLFAGHPDRYQLPSGVWMLAVWDQ